MCECDPAEVNAGCCSFIYIRIQKLVAHFCALLCVNYEKPDISRAGFTEPIRFYAILGCF